MIRRMMLTAVTVMCVAMIAGEVVAKKKGGGPPPAPPDPIILFCTRSGVFVTDTNGSSSTMLLETSDEYFSYNHRPGLGRWQIYGIHLSDDILRKVYYQNAQKLLGLK